MVLQRVRQFVYKFINKLFRQNKRSAPALSDMALTKPEKVSGGCLCGGVKFDISFNTEESWPPAVATCQCSICRKWTGALVSHDLIVKKSQVTPELSTFPTYTEFQSTTRSKRAFCSKCGSGFAFFSEDMPEDVIIFVGSIDEEHLMGKIKAESVTEDQCGKRFKRSNGLATVLTDASQAGNVYWQNVVPGVTDHFAGPKFLQYFVDKAPLPEPTI